MNIQIRYRQVGQSKLAIRPGFESTSMFYVPTERVCNALLEAEWASAQLQTPEILLNKARNMTNHELAREALERADDYLDGDGLRWMRLVPQ